MRAENLGLLLWGGVGTGKSFLAGCIANALMEQEVSVRMTNFARIMNRVCAGTGLQHHGQQIPQPKTADRHHQPAAERDTASTGYCSRPHL